MQKYYVMTTKQHLGNNALNLQSIQDKIYQLFLVPFNRLSIFQTGCQLITLIITCKDLVSQTNMVFLAPACYVSIEVRRVFNFLSKI